MDCIKEKEQIAGNSVMVQFHLFQGEDYLGWDCFNKDKVTVGTSNRADLVLPADSDHGLAMDEISAIFSISPIGVSVTDSSAYKQVTVSGNSVGSRVLGPLDYVTIGPYIIKIKVKPMNRVDADPERSLHSFAASEQESVDKPGLHLSDDTMNAVTPEPPRPKAAELEREYTTLPTASPKANFAPAPTPVTASAEEMTNKVNGGAQDVEQAIDALFSQPDEETPPEVLAFVEELNESVPKVREQARDALFSQPDEETPPEVMAFVEELNESVPEVREQARDALFSQPDEETPPEVQAFVEDLQESVPEVREPGPFSTPAPFLPEDIEAAAEDDDVEASFHLKDLLSTGSEAQARGGQVLEVVKTWKDTVVDVQFLNEREKYITRDADGTFCLAVHKKGSFYFFYNDRFSGHQQHIDGSEQTTESLTAGCKLISKKKGLYRNQIPKGAEIVLSDGQFNYRLRRSIKIESPKVTLPPREDTTFRKNLYQASGIHVILIMALGFFFSLPTIKNAPLPEERFVKIDASQLIKSELPPEKKELPKKTVVKKTAPKPQKMASKKQGKSRRQVNRRKANAKTGVAGGKKGNVVTKDVKQTGMLAILGNSGISLQPSEAMAAVTNLDAVSTPNNSRGGYQVNGVVASLGDANIELPSSGGIVTTQGSATVLRSGTSGKGEVAALKSGATGQRQVQSMVTATLDKNVKVQGGISREDVKRVIDQHIEEIQYCYESALISNPSIMGKLVLEWKILNDGSVGETPIKSSTLNSTSITGCVRKAVQSWRFPEPRGTDSVMVSYPFIFDIVGF